MKHNQLHFLLWVCVCTLWITLIAIVPDFLDNPIGDVRTGLTVASYVLACSVVSLLLFYAVGQSKWVTALLLPVYGIIGAAVSYYRVGYQVTITPVIIECMLNTNPETVRGVVGWQLIGWIVLNLCISIGFVVWRWRKITPLRYSVLQAAVAILLFIGYYSIPRMHRSLNQRYPLSVVHSLREYAIVQNKRNAPRTTPAYVRKEYIGGEKRREEKRREEKRRGEERRHNGQPQYHCGNRRVSACRPFATKWLSTRNDAETCSTEECCVVPLCTKYLHTYCRIGTVNAHTSRQSALGLSI